MSGHWLPGYTCPGPSLPGFVATPPGGGGALLQVNSIRDTTSEVGPSRRPQASNPGCGRPPIRSRQDRRRRRIAAPVCVGGATHDRSASALGLGKYSVDLVGESDVMCEFDPRRAMTAERRPQTEDNSTSLKEQPRHQAVERQPSQSPRRKRGRARGRLRRESLD